MVAKNCLAETENAPPEAGRFPDRVTLELTNKCNISCTFCPRQAMEKDLGFIDTSMALRIIDEMSQHEHIALVPFFRGEPLLHPYWKEIITYAKDQGIGPIQLTTNGTLLNRENIDAILNIGIDFISFSLDTTDPDLYKKTRRGADYHEVLQNIQSLIYLKEQRGGKIPEIQVSAVQTKLHTSSIDDFLAFWRNKVDRVRIYTEHSKDGNPGSISNPLPTFSRRRPCHKVFTDIVVYWDGKIALCNHDWYRDDQTIIGNASSESISDIWMSEQYRKIREMHHHGNLENFHPCDQCDHWKMYYVPDGFLGELHVREKR